MRCNNRDIELYMKGKKDGKEELQRENKQLKDNWNELKRILIKEVDVWECVDDDLVIAQVNEDKNILFIMKELEKGDSNE